MATLIKNNFCGMTVSILFYTFFGSTSTELYLNVFFFLGENRSFSHYLCRAFDICIPMYFGKQNSGSF